MAIGSIEGKFYAELIAKLGLDPKTLPKQHDRKRWQSLRAAIAATFRTKTRDEWCAIMEGSDSCFAPVLSLDEAPRHSHMAARESFVTRDSVTQPNAAPRFSRTPSGIGRKPPVRGEGGDAALAEWGVKAEVALASGE